MGRLQESTGIRFVANLPWRSCRRVLPLTATRSCWTMPRARRRPRSCGAGRSSSASSSRSWNASLWPSVGRTPDSRRPVTTQVTGGLPHINLRIVTPGGDELAQWGRGIRMRLRSEMSIETETCSDQRWGTLSGYGKRPSAFDYPLRRDLHWELELCAASTGDPATSGARDYLAGVLSELAGPAQRSQNSPSRGARPDRVAGSRAA